MLPTLKRDPCEIVNPEVFFSKLGWLHDADLLSFEWKTVSRNLLIEIEDLYSNFYQLPEYPGKLGACFIASELLDLEIDLIAQNSTPLRVLKFHVSQNLGSKCIDSMISFGEGWIKFSCQRLIGVAC